MHLKYCISFFPILFELQLINRTEESKKIINSFGSLTNVVKKDVR
jgi:hypothetical protein